MRDPKEPALIQVVRALWVAVVVAVGSPVLVESVARPQAAAAIGQWRDVEAAARPVSDAEATELADRLRREFRETLDLAPLVGRYFVADVGRRNMRDGSVQRWLGSYGASTALLDGLDEPTARRAFVAYFNLAHLQTAHTLGAQRLEDVADPTAIDPATAPPEVARAIATSRFHAGTAWIATREDLVAFLAEAEAIADAYRSARVPREPESAVYAANRVAVAAAERVVHTTPADRDSGYLELGVPPGSAIREVRRDGLLWYSIVREGGRARIVTVAFSEE
jgi:hypothetical protein